MGVGIGNILPKWSNFGLWNEKGTWKDTWNLCEESLGFRFFARLFQWHNLFDCVCWSNSANWKLDFYLKFLEENYKIKLSLDSNSLILSGLQWRRFEHWTRFPSYIIVKENYEKLEVDLVVNVRNKRQLKLTKCCFYLRQDIPSNHFTSFRSKTLQALLFFHTVLLDFISRITSDED